MWDLDTVGVKHFVSSSLPPQACVPRKGPRSWIRAKTVICQSDNDGLGSLSCAAQHNNTNVL